MRLPNPIRFFKALVAFFRRPEVAPDLVQRARRAVCSKCLFYDSRVDQCDVCTCFVDFKIILATESCPKGHWGQYFSYLNSGLRTLCKHP